jgi:hypothetical protein
METANRVTCRRNSPLEFRPRDVLPASGFVGFAPDVQAPANQRAGIGVGARVGVQMKDLGV